ncbi:S8 family serine peptidase [Ideonella sp. DXS29W]|uniref:S8 family serine peptidase n=1 Tax=Ideonella lacteola TaxID=2984193 RepID=A0ABU9BTG1_9BURK
MSRATADRATLWLRPRRWVGSWLLCGAAVLQTLALGGCASAATEPEAASAAMRDESSRYIVLAVDNPLSSPGGRAGASLGSYGAAPRYVLGSRAAATLAALAREHGLRETAGWPIVSLGWHCVVFELPAGAERGQVLAALQADPRVRLAQPLQEFDTQGATGPGAPPPPALPPSTSPTNSPGTPAATPTSPGAPTERVPYNDPYVDLQRSFLDMGAAQAHRISTGAGVRIAVVDTGAALNHPDLRGRILATRDLVGEPAARFEGDKHGTEVAGVIAAVGNNGEGIVGIAPQAGLEVFKACWGRHATGGAESPARCNSFTLAKALAGVLESNARIVNLSLGGPSDPLLEKLLGELLRQGRVIIGALPPDGRRGGFPTGVEGVLAVGVAGELQSPADASVIAAPGRDVLTLQPGTGYDYASGSSIAAAHVSAVAALLLAADPRLDRLALSTLLQGASQGRVLDAGAALRTLSTRLATSRRS